MRNMGLARREYRNDRQIDWIAFMVMTALAIVIFAEFRVIAKYIFG
jgi:hypothetical protein